MRFKDWPHLLGAILICEAAGLIGSVFTARSIPAWYAGIVKPSFNPPNWIFGPVWTALFVLMGIALYLVWRQGVRRFPVKYALAVFGLQLALNVMWTVIFFGLHSPFLAAIEIVVLWLAILWTIAAFWNASRAAAYLLLPYLLWVSFAAVLNFSIWRLN